MSALLALLAPVWPYLAAAGGAIAVLVGAYFKGGRDRARYIEAEQAREREMARNAAKEVSDEVDSLGPADVDARLRNHWMRDKAAR